MRRPTPPHLTTLALLLAGAFMPAWAAPVLGASSSASADGVTGTPFESSYSAPAYTSSNTSVGEAGGYANGSAFSNANGAYASSSRAEGRAADATAGAQLTYSLTNSASTAMQYSMSFYIYHGWIESMLNSSTSLTDDEILGASYSARISVGGVTRFLSSAFLQQTDTGFTWGKSGTDLNAFDDGSDGYYSWGGSTHEIDLGVLAAGETIEILAELDTGAMADVGTYDYGYGYGYGGGGTCTSFKGWGSAFYGDPAIFDGSELPNGPVTFTASAVNGVPEPTSLLLAGLGLGAAVLTTRRRRTPLQAI
jgi:hypothetical protein